jgi:hypothetical protein
MRLCSCSKKYSGEYEMTFKTLTMATSVLALSASFALAQSKPSCDEIANPKAGDNCDELAAKPGGDFLTGFGPLALLLLGGAAIAGGGGGTSSTPPPSS